ncbi:hypothetical protein PMPD1_4384 (plasmid) [Paramixta manurensis]|uniref:Uncharacterized protein n=1 Tax=Paramixta manurensis TaxID=2740817 RepID=A0A6M8UQX9_9GAMM|nr:hypothetical protein PMPD1_4384 [Erwiniaceae bacterium PD-1]
MKNNKILLPVITASCLLFSGLTFASSVKTERIPGDSGAQNFIKHLTTVSPEMGKLAEDINNSSKANCGSSLSERQIKNIVSDNNEYVALLKELMTDKAYTSTSAYRDRINGIAGEACNYLQVL